MAKKVDYDELEPTEEKGVVAPKIPYGDVPARAYAARHVELTFQSADQATTMKRVLDGLVSRGATTVNGRRVRTIADAFRWIVEEISKNIR